MWEQGGFLSTRSRLFGFLGDEDGCPRTDRSGNDGGLEGRDRAGDRQCEADRDGQVVEETVLQGDMADGESDEIEGQERKAPQAEETRGLNFLPY